MTRALLLLPLLLAAVTGSELYYCDTVTPSHVVTPQPSPLASHRRPEDILLSLCPPKLKDPIKSTRKNLLIVINVLTYQTIYKDDNQVAQMSKSKKQHISC